MGERSERRRGKLEREAKKYICKKHRRRWVETWAAVTSEGQCRGGAKEKKEKTVEPGAVNSSIEESSPARITQRRG